jgi:hypothetical protein
MFSYRLRNQRRFYRRRQSREANENDPSMDSAEPKHKFPEVLIRR